MKNKKASKYRWIMMILAALPSMVVNCAQFQLSAYTAEFMKDFSLTLTQYSSVVFSSAIVTGLIGIFAGTLQDRFGVKKVVAIGGIVTTAASVIRLFSSSYPVFFVMSMLIGAMAGTGTAAVAKISKAWFSKKERSLCVCIICSGGAIGVVIGQLAASVFSGYRQALAFSTGFSAISTVAWLILGRDTGYDYEKSESILKHLGPVVKSKNIWLIAAGCSFFAAFMFGTTGLLPNVLISDKGITNAQAVNASSMLNVAAIAGLFIMPVIQRKIGKYKPVLLFTCGISAVCFAALFIVPNWLISPIIFLIGFFGGTIVGFFLAMLPSLKEIKQSAMGSANGVTTLSQYILGSFLLSTYVITPLTALNGRFLYIADIILCIIMLVISALLPETGNND